MEQQNGESGGSKETRSVWFRKGFAKKKADMNKKDRTAYTDKETQLFQESYSHLL